MPPLPPPNTLAQLEEACRRLEEVSTKTTKPRYAEKAHWDGWGAGGGTSPLCCEGLWVAVFSFWSVLVRDPGSWFRGVVQSFQ